MKTFIAIYLMTMILQGMVDISVAECPDRYVPLGTGCYHFSVQENITWYQAYFVCHIELNGYLVEIESQMEQNNLRHYIETDVDPEGKYVFWLGATDLLKEGEYRWMTSGNLMTFNNWYPKKPDNKQDPEDCVLSYKSLDYMWDDFQCASYILLRAICEADPL